MMQQWTVPGSGFRNSLRSGSTHCRFPTEAFSAVIMIALIVASFRPRRYSSFTHISSLISRPTKPLRTLTTMSRADSTSTPSVTLSSTSAKMPLVGMGLWKVPTSVCADSVYAAIKSGYRLFDGASDYGNEVECGRGIARAIQDGLVRREDLFITSKLWNTFHAAEHVAPACERSLSDWGLAYFDLYLVHFPIALKYGASWLVWYASWG